MNHPRISSAPNLTNAALTMMGVNLTWVLIAIWAVYGWIPVLMITIVLNHAITRFQQHRGR